ncbi:phenylhydantoinase [Ureibacillus massiliensis 4400831 = CIP 108448 = CCUG 49529]|uniref:Phenylhydantoinase n=1 Tax=Ureibacillus massiliensis 4400831 = CIP 108448 = CCUG 49529 TaxID=1211035 RepID=A0A0A3J937_9BACL|nr:dihydropyrimidinase [Ureibacillus massiliensis]KGR92265.1 phenylhydantoinase [Ureibacillus massiliensis 4400831 = CIP 108448 = CCUG 49529]
MTKKIIKGGTIATATDIFEGDILIEGEKIVQIGKDLLDTEAEIIDATGKYVFPGGIDPHTHLDMPFNNTVTDDDWESGTIAAAFGGTTTILDFALTAGETKLSTAVEKWHEKATGKAVIDYGFHLMVTDLNEETEKELPLLLEKEGITSIKVFMAYAKEFQASDNTLFKAFKAGKETGAVVMVHCENGSVIDELVEAAKRAGNTAPIYHALTRPPELEGEATKRAIELAHVAGAKLYVVHVTCKEAVDEIVKAREKGYDVYGETCPPYLTLDQSLLAQPGFEGAKYVWSPPLRPKSHQEPLWNALKAKQLQTIGSDQCSFSFNGKKQLGLNDFSKIPNGGPFIEDRFTVLYSEGVTKGRISINDFVDAVSTSAAKIFGLFPQKGTIAIGSDADIVIFDPNVKRIISAETHHMNVDYNAFEGMEVTGEPVSVLLRGEFIVKDKEFVGTIGGGKYIKRPLKKKAASTLEAAVSN